MVASILIGVLSFGYFSYDRVFLGRSVPLWDTTAMIYGGVFVVFLFLDAIGKTAVSLRSDSDRNRAAARPVPNGTGPNVVRARTRASYEQVVLTRTMNTATEAWMEKVDTAISEVLALDDRIPQRDVSGHVAPEYIPQSFKQGYAFFIQYQGEQVGICSVEPLDTVWSLNLLYVDTVVRRRGVALQALLRLTEFVQLLDSERPLSVTVSANNARAMRFFEAAGWRSGPPSAGNVSYQTSDVRSGSEI